MRLDNKEPNYCATVVRVNHLVPLIGMDNCVGLPVFGCQAIVRKDSIELGQLGVLFTTETQLSEDFCKNNNMYRHADRNIDIDKTGFMEDSARVRAIKLRNHNSNSLFMSLQSLQYLGIDINEFKEGDCFTHINNIEICRKYVIKTKESSGFNKVKNSGPISKLRVEPKLIPEHVSTTHWCKVLDTINDDQWIIVQDKIHGTSVRLANQICTKKLTYWEKWAKWFGIEVNDKEYDYFACSRRVIKDYKRHDVATMQHFYKTDIYNQAMEKVRTLIPKNTIFFGELIGWSGDAPIQKNYTYSIPQGEFELYIYRIASVNSDGFSVDWSWNQIKEFCLQTSLKHTTELWQGYKKDFNHEAYMDKNFYFDLGIMDCPKLDKNLADEGVVIRIEGIQPNFYKAKCNRFLAHETKTLDDGVIDMETIESEI